MIALGIRLRPDNLWRESSPDVRGDRCWQRRRNRGTGLQLNQGRGVARNQFSYYNNRWMREKYIRETSNDSIPVQRRVAPHSNREMQQVDRSYILLCLESHFFFRQAGAECSALIGGQARPVFQIFHPQSETREALPGHSWSYDVVLSSAGAELGLDLLLVRYKLQSYAPTVY